MNNLKLAWLNIKAKKFKYIIIFLLIMVASISIYTSNILHLSLNNGLNSARQKLGADIIIVPSNQDKDVEKTLFEGVPCTLTFDSSISKNISTLKNVEKTCSQLYIATLSGADCCDNSTQLIAFSYKDDFVIGPWIKESITNLKDDEIILGASHALNVGDTVKYYNKQFKVAAKLEKTGLGYDDSAFITYGAAQDIVSNNKDKFTFDNVKDVSSMIFIKTSDPSKVDVLAKTINGQFGNLNIETYTANNKINTIAKEISNLNIFGTLSKIITIILTSISLFAIIVITTFQRRNEIGSMLTIGITKNEIIKIFLLEYVIVSFSSIIFSILGVQLVFSFFENALSSSFGLPFVLPSIIELLVLILKLVIANLFMIIFSILFQFIWIKKKSPAEMIKEIGA